LFTKVVSGGQTGVDRAALDVALEKGLPCGGWCPKGRRAEDGPLDARYPLTETPWSGYPQRTEWNVRDSDGTLVLTVGGPDRGTALTLELAARHRRPCLVVDLNAAPDVEDVRSWARESRVGILNVAGPRESSAPGIYARAADLLRRLFS
jgi:putative molybdenum carrier protein